MMPSTVLDLHDRRASHLSRFNANSLSTAKDKKGPVGCHRYPCLRSTIGFATCTQKVTHALYDQSFVFSTAIRCRYQCPGNTPSHANTQTSIYSTSCPCRIQRSKLSLLSNNTKNDVVESPRCCARTSVEPLPFHASGSKLILHFEPLV